LIDEPQVLQFQAQDIAFIRITVARGEIQDVMGSGYRELIDALDEQGVTPAGAWFNHHLKMDPQVFDFALSVPLASPISASGRVRPGVLPAAKVARTVYHGPYEGLPDAWGEFSAWIASQGLNPRPDLWECYLTEPESNPDAAMWQTELNQPLMEA
jgi:effector-binding domain-containing protein